jgi:hypothetical protein
MKLKVAGVDHNDLLGRDRLLNWFYKIKQSEKNLPLFVAVEYDEGIFHRIRSQRPILRALAAQVWPGSPGSILEVVQDSLVYEGDLHKTVFPEVETLWLDQGRMVDDPTIISNYAHDRLNIYKSFVPREATALTDDTLLTMSARAWKRAVPPRASDRDEKLACVILDRLREQTAAWAIAVVGFSHAAEIEDSMVLRLRSRGIECHVNQLSPQGITA